MTTSKNSNLDTEMNFKDMVESIQEITPCPVKEVRCGFKYYKELRHLINSLVSPTIHPKTEIDTLYGIKILIDPSLKPNEFKFVTSNSHIL